MRPMRLTSQAFEDGEPIPRQFTQDGDDRSPALAWSEVPEDTRELALIMDDPDAPGDEPFVHWVIYSIPAATHELPEGLAKENDLAQPVRVKQGFNSFPKAKGTGYRGPAPPKGHGMHHYRFRLYALDSALDLASGLRKGAVLNAMKGHVLEESELVGTY